MTTGATGQLGLALPVQGELSGTWGDTVNNGITEYTNIAIAATLTLTGDGAVTLANTTGDASASNIVSTLTGAGTVTAQFAIVRVTGTLTTAKVVTGPSYSKTYVIDNAATGGIVTFKAAGQTGVSVAVGEKCSVYFNGTDYVKYAGTVDTGVTSFTAGTTGFTPSTATTGEVTLAGTLAPANGGTGVANNAASTLTISGNFASNFTVSGAYTYTFPGQTSSLGYLNIPNSGAKTTSYTLAIGDVGKFIELGTGGSVVVPASIFAAGDAISIFNNTGSSISCTCSAVTTVYKGGTDADISSFSVTTRGVATILFVTATVAVVTGNLV
jgi:hypothetical protein